MADEDVRKLARELRKGQTSPGDSTYVRRGKIVAVNSTVATVTIGGKDVAGVSYYKHVTLAVGDAVDVLFDGPTPRVLGVLR